MRRLGLLVVLIVVIVFPGAANAAWKGGTPWPYASYSEPDQLGFDRFNTGFFFAEADYTPGAGYFLNSLDGGSRWDEAGWLTAGGRHFDLALDGDGNRIWSYALSNTIAVTRATWSDGPGDVATTRYFPVPRVSDIEIAANAAGDVLISWSNHQGDPGVAFWKSGADAPGPIKILPNAYNCGGSEAPTPFLDPSGSATLAWTCDGAGVNQASTQDANDPGSWGASERVTLGEIVTSGQAPDGRAVLLSYDTETIPENSFGSDNTRVLKYATRIAGSSFIEPEVLVGDSNTSYMGAANQVAVTPDGRVLTGYSTSKNLPYPQYFCDEDGKSPYEPASFMAEGTIDPDGGELTFKKTLLSPPDVTGAWVTKVAVGPDGRLALAHGSTTFCGVDTRPTARERILLSFDGSKFESVPNPYYGIWSFDGFAFTAKGDLFITARNVLFGPPNYDIYETSSPLAPAMRPATPGSTETVTDVGAKSIPAATVRPQISISSVKRLKNGKLSVSLRTNVPGAFTVVAKTGRKVVAKTSAKAKAGSTKLQIKLNYKSSKLLTPSGELKARLTVSFKPNSGDPPAPVTKHVTFKK